MNGESARAGGIPQRISRSSSTLASPKIPFERWMAVVPPFSYCSRTGTPCRQRARKVTKSRIATSVDCVDERHLRESSNADRLPVDRMLNLGIRGDIERLDRNDALIREQQKDVAVCPVVRSEALFGIDLTCEQHHATFCPQGGATVPVSFICRTDIQHLLWQELFAASLRYLCCLIAVIASTVSAQVIHVDASRPPGGGGTTWGDAIDQLQLALNMVEASIVGGVLTPPEIWVRATAQPYYVNDFDVNGVPAPADPRDRSFRVFPGTKLYGGFAGTETTLLQRAGLFRQTVLDGDFQNT